MNNEILIHNDNISKSVSREFESQNIIHFDYLSSDYNKLDDYISKVIVEDLKTKNFNMIFIKDNLSLNYLELYGLRVAYHIRLSQELGEKKFIPIVILSDLNTCGLNKIEPMSRITFTKNVYVEPNNLLIIEKYKNKTFSKFNEINYQKDFLDLINIESPENSTNHSIANEWAIYKWAKELGITDSQSINNTIAKISNHLYFKYLQQLHQIEDDINILEEKKQVKCPPSLKIVKQKATSEKKIMIIDDELDKGWEDIFEEYFKKKRNFTISKDLPFEFKNKNYEDIEENIINIIFEEKPDLIILDMRLVVIDHKKETNPEDISGIKLLNKIKCTSLDTKLNPGIQVVMLSATTRSDILEQAYKENKIVGYIQKDHMENRFFSTKENIEKLSELLINAEKNFYMKNIWSTQKEILNFNIIKRSSDEYMISIKLQVESIFNLLNSNLEKKINLVILSFYNIIEFLIKYYGGTHGSGFSQIKDICNDKLGIHTLDTSLSEIICTRNYKAHGEDETEIQKYCQKNTIKDPNNTYIVKWFEAIKEILKEINKKESK